MDSPPKFYKTRGKCEQGPIRHIHRNIEFNNVKKKKQKQFTTRSCSPVTLSANEHKTLT